MSDKWMTVAEAAATLNVHTRTIERRIAGGKIQARRNEQDILQVLITLSDTPDTSDSFENSSDMALETVRELAADQVSLATGSASALVKFAQNDALRTRDELELVRRDVRRARTSSLVAWCVVALLGTGVTVAVGWVAQKITRANEDVRHLTEYARQMENEAKKLVTDRDTARQEAQTAKVDAAQASGMLAAYQEQMDIQMALNAARPTTRPTTLLERLSTAFSEP